MRSGFHKVMLVLVLGVNGEFLGFSFWCSFQTIVIIIIIIIIIMVSILVIIIFMAMIIRLGRDLVWKLSTTTKPQLSKVAQQPQRGLSSSSWRSSLSSSSTVKVAKTKVALDLTFWYGIVETNQKYFFLICACIFVCIGVIILKCTVLAFDICHLKSLPLIFEGCNFNGITNNVI